MFNLGVSVDIRHFIPPKQQKFMSVGLCGSDCTRNGLPSNGVAVVNGFLHAHLSGRAIRLRCFEALLQNTGHSTITVGKYPLITFLLLKTEQ